MRNKKTKGNLSVQAIAGTHVDADARRAEALEAERRLQEPAAPVAEPARLRERPPKTVIERAEWREAARRQACRDEIDEILDG
jgi:hypothetical protein